MHLIALELRCSPVSFASSVLCLPEACPNHGKSHSSRVIDPVLKRNFPTIFMTHRQAVPNLSFQPRFLSSPTMIGNP